MNNTFPFLKGKDDLIYFTVYNPEGLDMAALREVVEAVLYPGLDISPMER